MWRLYGSEEQKFLQMVMVTWPRWPPCPYMVKTLKNLLLWNQKADDLETWYAASSTQVLPNSFKWWPWVDLDLFYCKVKFGLLCLWEKGKTMDFSETIVVCDLKLATDVQSDKKFLLTSKLCPFGAVCPLHPAPGLYTSIKSWKKLYKISFKEISLKLATNG